MNKCNLYILAKFTFLHPGHNVIIVFNFGKGGPAAHGPHLKRHLPEQAVHSRRPAPAEGQTCPKRRRLRRLYKLNT